MLPRLVRIGCAAGVMVLAGTAAAFAQTAPPQPSRAPATVAQAQTVPSPSPTPLSLSGYFRSYYFTRQNASNNPGAQFNFSSSKYSSIGVNQAAWNNAISLSAEYRLPDQGGLSIGGSYLYANPLNGECAYAPNHLKGGPCVSQVPPNTNADDTLPDFELDTFYQAYLAYHAPGWYAKAGDQLFTSPWANPSDTRLKPAAFQGADVAYTGMKNWTFELADMWQFEPRTSSAFQSNTLLTSYPAGNPGLPTNLYVPYGGSITTSGFAYGKVGYNDTDRGYNVDGYFYGVSDLVTMWWGDAKYYFLPGDKFKPYIALQGGYESNAGQSYLGKVQSQVIGAQIGANVSKNVLLMLGFDDLPWRTDTVALPKGVTCSSSTEQITAKGTSFGYFLPLVNNGTSQCTLNANGSANIYYGGWASPYTDSYTSDPLFTTSISQGMVERRAAGTSEKLTATYTSDNKRVVFIASYAFYDYSNAGANDANTHEWDLDGSYRFSHYKGTGAYKGLMLRDRFMNRSIDDTFCGASATSCPRGETTGSQYLDGLPLFRYNRAQLEYDF